MTNPNWFPGRLRELREKSGLTQEQLADRAGVKRDAVARWESGRREPGWSNVLALCAALGVTCEAFTQKPTPRPPVGPGRPRKASANAEGTARGRKCQGKGKLPHEGRGRQTQLFISSRRESLA
jgi:transcriptional regulator with XRE-family HTH domain